MQASLSRRLPWLGAWLLVSLVFLGAASLFQDWLVDDAAISLAYSRSLAAGLGHVPQPGADAVEGYSNPLWVYTFAALALAGFPLLAAAKVVGTGLGLACLALVLALARELSDHPLLVGGGAALFLGLQPAFVTWTVSGLENPLTAFLVLGMTLATIYAPRHPRAATLAGLAAGLLAWTRPEAAIHGCLPAAWLAWRAPDRLRDFALPWWSLIMGLLLVRLAIFGEVVPNTYFVKGGVPPSRALAVLTLQPDVIQKLMPILSGTFGVALSNALTLLALALTVQRGLAGRLPPPARLVAAGALWHLGVYLLLPADWMSEYRFATAFYPLFYLWVLAALSDALAGLGSPPPRAQAVRVTALVAALLAVAVPELYYRMRRLEKLPNISVAFVQDAYVARFARWGAALGVPRPKVLLPDVGAALLSDQLEVVDLAGLCDATIARTLGKDPAALREFLLGAARPDFMHLVDKWAVDAALSEDPRFERDYRELHGYSAAHDPGAAGVRSGYFVRRQLASDHPEAFAAIVAEPHAPRERFLRPQSPSLVRGWLDRLFPWSPRDAKAKAALARWRAAGVR